MSERLLVVGPSWVGDMVMADTLFQHLASKGASIDVLAPGWSLPVMARMKSVQQGIEVPLGHGELGLSRRRQLGRKLRAHDYDRAIVLPRSFKAALVPFFAGIPRRTGFRGEFRFGLINDIREFDKSVLDQTVRRFLWLGLEKGEALPAEVPQPALFTDEQSRAAALTDLGLFAATRQIALMPGAEYGPAKCWPLAYFRELAESLITDGYGVWVLGSAKDRAAGDTICEGLDARNLCGETSLEQVMDVLAVCEAAISNDSGLMHVAAAVGCNVVALYGSSSPHFTPPLTRRSAPMHLGIECSPCFKRECPLGHFRCMNEMHPASVKAALYDLLAANA